MADLEKWFQKVVLINLKRRPDRLREFRAQVKETGWPFREPELFEAVDGNLVPVPRGWPAQGMGGAYGCLKSHSHVLESCLMQGVKSVLVLEDDCCWHSTFVEDCKRFLEMVPDDWDQLMLGGQHCAGTTTVASGVVRCTNTQRTHAYAIRGKMLRELYALWNSKAATTHCDWLMGPFQKQWRVYAPEIAGKHPWSKPGVKTAEGFICGQRASYSDICGREQWVKFHTAPIGDEPILLLQCPLSVVRQLRLYGVHTGLQRDPDTDIDVGLQAVFEDRKKLGDWISELQRECVSDEGSVLGVYHPRMSDKMLRRAWKGEVITVSADNLEDALSSIPMKLKRKAPPHGGQKVILLRAPRHVVAELRLNGWHFGNWIDETTGYDNGLRAWAHRRDPGKLRETVDILLREAEGMTDAVATLWHPDLQALDVATVSRARVCEITAGTVEEAQMQRDALELEEMLA